MIKSTEISEHNKQEKEWRIIDIIKWGEEYFASKGIESPRLNIEILLSELLNSTRLGLYLHYEQPLLKTELEKLKELIKRRVKFEPLAYITGYAYFRELRLKVNRSTLIPRPETELIVDYAEEILNEINYTPRILDIGTGSGCIAIAISRNFPKCEIIAIDDSDEALEIAIENAKFYKCQNITFRKMNILTDIPDDKFDLIISNPPYLSLDEFLQTQPEIRNYERMENLTDGLDGYTFYRRFAQVFPDMLKRSGKFILEIGYNQSAEMYSIFTQEIYEIEIFKDLSNIERYVVGLIKN